MNKEYKIEMATLLLKRIRDFTLDNDLELLTLNKQEYHIINYYINYLQEENERKERLITQYGEGMCAYANRIDKAIEYIKSDWYKLNTMDIEHAVNLGKDIRIDLLNILQNGSDNDDK